MTLPTFLYIGAPRAGSTWMFEALKQHPEVFVPSAKYVKYFLEEQFWRGQQWYESFFSEVNAQHKAYGELTTGYLYHPDALSRIANTIPDVKILATLRNPIERDWSAYLFMKRNRKFSGTFREAMNSDLKFISEYSQYAKYLPTLYTLFPKENIKVLLFDDLNNDPENFAADIFSFIGVDPAYKISNLREKKYSAARARIPALAKIVKGASIFIRKTGHANLIGKVKSSGILQRILYEPIAKSQEKEFLSLEDYQYLQSRYEPEINRLEKLLDRDLFSWRTLPSILDPTVRNAVQNIEDIRHKDLDRD